MRPTPQVLLGMYIEKLRLANTLLVEVMGGPGAVSDPAVVRRIVSMVAQCAEKLGHHDYAEELRNAEDDGHVAFQMLRLVDEGSVDGDPDEDRLEQVIVSTGVRNTQWMLEVTAAAVNTFPVEDPHGVDYGVNFWGDFLDAVHGVLEDKPELIPNNCVGWK